MKTFLNVSGSALALCLSAPLVFAQQGSEPLRQVVVTSSRIATPLRQVGTSVAVITEQQIEAHGNFSLLDILRQMPSTASSSNGGAGKVSALRIRGEEGYRTLTIFDGIRLLDPSAPQIGPQVEQILSSGVGRVEMLRGPQGLSYGADAGGVVNLVSRQDSEGFNIDLDIDSGAFGTRQAGGIVSGRSDQLDYFFSATDFSTDGFNSRSSDAALRDDDGYDNTTLHGRFGIQLSDSWRLEAVHRDVGGVTEFDGCFSATVVNDCESDYDLQASRVSVDYSADGVAHTLAYASTETDRQNYALGLPTFGVSGTLERFEYLGSVSNLPGFDLVFGADLEQADSGTSSRDNQGVFLEYLSDFSDSIFVTAGIRHDDNDDFGTNLSYRFSGAYLVDLGADATLKLRGAYGTGFRAPSLFEVEYNSGPFAFVPAALISLEQEKSRGYELAVEYFAGNRLKLEAVYFDQEIEDVIYFDVAGFSGYLQDPGVSNSDGVELSARYLLTHGFEIAANYTYNETERPNGQQRIRRPKDLANLAFSYRTLDDRLTVNAFVRFSRNAVDEVLGMLTPLDNFNVLDLNVSYDLSDNISLVARLENATNEKYQEVIDYNSARRAFFLGVRLAF
ncbi:MAG: TonB-dependent receptor [Gammaproteobacteria bacterium]|nr:TonB-dependent receptor [Gammaproteobacteria bacterium]